MPPKRTTTPMTDAAIKVLIAQGVATALAGYEANRGSEINKMEIEMWNLKVKGTDVGSVMAFKPKTMQEAIEIANDLMDQKVQAVPKWAVYCKVQELKEGWPHDPGLNQTRGTEAHGMVYALRGGETDQDLDDMEDDINA
ncbi:hypothetical protein Tco_0686545 [Tanacetum coccineum]